MTIKRLRPAYSPEELEELYATPHSHAQFPDHVIRVDHTLQLATELLDSHDSSGADLSCGDGAILRALNLKAAYFGDFAPGYAYQGPIEQTVGQIPSVDVFVFCETIEHVEDPWMVLKLIRAKCKKLILSTPLDEFNDENPEHYWGWDKKGMRELLRYADFHPKFYRETNPPYGYRFQIWGCT